MKTMISKFVRPAIMVMVILVITLSCQQDDVEVTDSLTKNQTHSGMIKLGKKLDNPHILNNMRKAYQNLISSGKVSEEINLEATDLYVRFLPKSHVELESLQDDTTVIFFDHPLDYEFLEYGTYYHDPTIPDTLPTWQYGVVPVHYKFPNVHYELLDSAFVPNNYETEEGRVSSFEADFLDQLEEESFVLTGNWEREENAKNCPDFRPSGYIRVNGRAIQGVEVVATNFLDNKDDLTNASGYYYIDEKFKRSVKMHVKWQRYEFHVKDGWLSEAQYIDKEECGNWSVDFDDQSESAFHAHIFRAAYHYYYKSITIRRPPENGFWNERMQLRAYYENNDESNGNHNAARRILGNWIKIYNPYRTEEAIYSTTIHELNHASLWKHSKETNKEDKLRESLARGVEWVLTREEYPGYLGRERSTGEYTLVVCDLIDGPATTATRINFGFIDVNAVDDVSGYTLRQVEDAIMGETSWNGWRDNLKSKFNNVTEGEVDKLFNAYN